MKIKPVIHFSPPVVLSSEEEEEEEEEEESDGEGGSSSWVEGPRPGSSVQIQVQVGDSPETEETEHTCWCLVLCEGRQDISGQPAQTCVDR